MTAPKLMTLTDAAAERIRALMSASGKDATGLRIGVKKGGCAGMEYTMSYAETKAPHDEVVEDKGVRILIDPTAVLFLLGTEMDYRSDRMTSGFVFNNPNQTGSCGCGESVSLTPASDPRRGLSARVTGFASTKNPRHGRARPGHPRISVEPKNVDGRHKAGHDREFYWLDR